MIQRLFGTDGIRSRIGQPPLDEPSLITLGHVFAQVFQGKRILIGRDTRASGEWLEQILTRCLCRSADLFLCGVVPTPGLAYLVRHGRFDVGIILSASHNPCEDNGIKIINRRGEKIGDRIETRITRLFREAPPAPLPPLGTCRSHPLDDYIQFLRQQLLRIPEPAPKLVLDCANGAVSAIVGRVFDGNRQKVRLIHASPDGTNINRGCGSTDPRSLSQEVKATQADLGAALDGDGDRLQVVDETGNLVDGDRILYLLSEYLTTTVPGFPAHVVGTVMSNLGLERALQERGIGFSRAAVGDRFVYREMTRRRARIGGEPSGHIILKPWQNSGDGLLVTFQVQLAMRYFRKPLSRLSDRLQLFPQQNRSIPISRKRDLDDWPELQAELDHFRKREGADSRLLVRYSGTEPIIRVMIESRRHEVIETYMEKICQRIAAEIGG